MERRNTRTNKNTRTNRPFSYKIDTLSHVCIAKKKKKTMQSVLKILK